MADTALRVMGLMALPEHTINVINKFIQHCTILYHMCVHLPDIPPYVVRFSKPTLGQGEPSALSPIKPETVLVAVTPSAPPITQHNIYRLVNRHLLIIRYIVD